MQIAHSCNFLPCLARNGVGGSLASTHRQINDEDKSSGNISLCLPYAVTMVRLVTSLRRALLQAGLCEQYMHSGWEMSAHRFRRDFIDVCLGRYRGHNK